MSFKKSFQITSASTMRNKQFKGKIFLLGLICVTLAASFTGCRTSARQANEERQKKINQIPHTPPNI